MYSVYSSTKGKMQKTKIEAITEKFIPIEWTGNFDGKKIIEKVEYQDGTILEMELKLSKARQASPSETFSGTIPQVLIEIEDEYDEEDDEEEIYVMVGDEENPELVHKDIVDVYIECMDDVEEEAEEVKE